MSYNKTVWESNQIIEAELLNNIENGIETLETKIDNTVANMSASVTKAGKVSTISISDKNGTTTANVNDGITFTPSVSNAGILSWTNDGNAQNPSNIDLVSAVINAIPDATGVDF